MNNHPNRADKWHWRRTHSGRHNAGTRTGRRYSHLRRAEARARKGR